MHPEKRSHSISLAARRIRELCAETRVSFAELSRRTGISQQAMQRWWKGQTVPELESRKACAAALNVPLSQLLHDSENESSAKDANEREIDDYIASPLGIDLSDEEKMQLRLCGPWLPGDQPLTQRHIHHMADFIRMRIREPHKVPTLNASNGRKAHAAPKKKRPRR